MTAAAQTRIYHITLTFDVVEDEDDFKAAVETEAGLDAGSFHELLTNGQLSAEVQSLLLGYIQD